MEELQVIETTSGRQFKPWASKEDVQAIGQETVQAVGQAVQDPASVTAIASEIAGGKQAIASAINAKGGEASATESFSELAQDIQDTPTSGILSNGIVQSEPFSFVDTCFTKLRLPITEINDSSVTTIQRSLLSGNLTLHKVVMSGVFNVSGDSIFEGCANLTHFEMNNLRYLYSTRFLYGCNLQSITLPNLLEIGSNKERQFEGNPLKFLYFPAAYIVGAYNWVSNGLVEACFGTLTYFYGYNVAQTFLRNQIIGDNTNINLNFSGWTATNVIAEGQSGIDELNSNLYNNLLIKLYDHSEDGQTRTLRIGWLARVTAENIAYANAKGWTLTT